MTVFVLLLVFAIASICFTVFCTVKDEFTGAFETAVIASILGAVWTIVLIVYYSAFISNSLIG